MSEDAFSERPTPDVIRVQVVRIDPEKQQLICFMKKTPEQKVVVRYDTVRDNRRSEDPFEDLWEGAQLNLIHYTVDDAGIYAPEYIILEPDYLIDASAIAECFQDYAVTPLHYFRNKFEEKENSGHLLLGNLANFFLDELVFASDPDQVSFQEAFLRSFKQSPFEYTSCEDIRSETRFREFMQQAQRQFDHIRRVIRDDFPRQQIDLHACTLEPSFFCEKYGFQGRLDLLHLNPSLPNPTHSDQTFPGQTCSGQTHSNPTCPDQTCSGQTQPTPNDTDATNYGPQSSIAGPLPTLPEKSAATDHDPQISMTEPILQLPGKMNAQIVELKSGRLPYPAYDKEKIALNHEVQTVVYRLLIESVFGRSSSEITSSILYSRGEQPGENLRKASPDKRLVHAILNLRNRIVVNEQLLITGDNSAVEQLFSALFASAEQERGVPRFYLNRLQHFEDVLTQCREQETAYFYRFTRFVSRELYHQKIGDIAYESPTGTASLWNSDFNERAEALNVLYRLSILHIDDSGREMTILFRRNQPDNDIVNFREGDICIVYPRKEERDTVLNKQILKGSIGKITEEQVEVHFRYKQKNRRYFSDNPFWAIEHDTLDTSYHQMFRGLFSFLKASREKRALLLGERAPGTSLREAASAGRRSCATDNDAPQPVSGQFEDSETEKDYHNRIINQALHASDYFLMIGPPGSGKTSIFARRLIEAYYENRETNIMVLAYTNRAVDELCDAINVAFGCRDGRCDRYIRVGSELSCSERYRHRLLQQISARAKDRESLRDEIRQTRIYVSTLASINGRPELFTLKRFHVAIIDEASQILEPQIIGLLPHFDRFILIGDHNQLSTIVLQDASLSAIREPVLREIGLSDCRESLFERLLRRCIAKGWDHAYTQLTRQGRMHNELSLFPATYFYAERLHAAQPWQSETWKLQTASEDLFCCTIAHKRTVFFSTEQRQPSSSPKINEAEAEIITRLVEALQTVYRENGMLFDPQKIGIIAPYRNQVAMIKHRLVRTGIPEVEKIMIDTVERFQGSQRDVILISFCVNEPYQLDYLCNLNREGNVDRKLNVAITRARQQLFLIGNATVLRKHPVYATLLNFYRDKTIIL